jgi:hypothetical protein
MRAPVAHVASIRAGLERAQGQVGGLQGLLELEPPSLEITRSWLEWVEGTRADLADTAAALTEAAFTGVWEEAEAFRRESAGVLDVIEVIDNHLAALFASLDRHRLALEQKGKQE